MFEYLPWPVPALLLKIDNACQKQMLGWSQVYYWRFKYNTHNNYIYIIKTIEREATTEVDLGWGWTECLN